MSAYIREVSSCNKWQLTQNPTTEQHSENATLECSAPNGLSLSHSFSQRLGIFVGGKGETVGTRVYILHTQQDRCTHKCTI